MKHKELLVISVLVSIFVGSPAIPNVSSVNSLDIVPNEVDLVESPSVDTTNITKTQDITKTYSVTETYQISQSLSDNWFSPSIYFNSQDVMYRSGTTWELFEMEKAPLNLINSLQAGDNLDIMWYSINREWIVWRTCSAKRRGVNVRVVADYSNYNETGYKEYGWWFRQLERCGIPIVVSTYSSRLMHNKALIAYTSEGEPIGLLTGSANYTWTGFTYNMNNIIGTSHAGIINLYRQEFNQMFEDHLFSTAKQPISGTFEFDNMTVSIYFAPTVDIESVIIDKLASARKNIYGDIFFLTQQNIADAILSIPENALNNSYIVWDASGASNYYSKDNYLCSRGFTNLKIEDRGGKEHQKTLIVDTGWGNQCIVVTGSYNFTRSARDSNDENVWIMEGDCWTSFLFAWEVIRVYEAMPDCLECQDHSAEQGIYACYDRQDNDYDGFIDSCTDPTNPYRCDYNCSYPVCTPRLDASSLALTNACQSSIMDLHDKYTLNWSG